MIITINTKEDSHEDVRKVIRMLQNLVGEHETFTNRNIFEDSSPTLNSSQPTNAFGSMFGDSTNVLSSTETTAEKKEDEKTPEVVVYDC